MTTKRQQTMAKLTRERAVKEKRERKLEKKRAAAAAKKDRANGIFPAVDPESSDSLLDPESSDRSSIRRARTRSSIQRAQPRSSIRMRPMEMIVRYWGKAWCPACSRYWSATSIRW